MCKCSAYFLRLLSISYLFCALSAIFASAFFAIYDPCARSLPAIATDINIFELISTSHICQLSAICYEGTGGGLVPLSVYAAAS